MKAIVHIGFPKAGSSTIQDFLFLNTAALAKRGVRFHRNVPGRGSQFEYPAAVLGELGPVLLAETEIKRYLMRNTAEINATHTPYLTALADFPNRFSEPLAVFSSEHIVPWLRNKKTVSAFAAHFSKTFEDVRYVAYIRDPIAVIPSAVSEATKRGEQRFINKFIDQFVQNNDWSKTLLMWADVVGHDQFDLRLLQPSSLYKQDLIEDFCHYIGVSSEGLQTPDRSNPSLTLPGMLALRLIAKEIPGILVDEGGPNPDFMTAVQKVMKLTKNGQKLRLSADQQARIESGTAEWQERLRATFFPEADRLFPQRASETKNMNFKAANQRAGVVAAKVIAQLKS